MKPDAHGIEKLEPPAQAVSIAAKEVARLARTGPDKRWAAAVDTGIAEARSLIKPRALWMPLTEDGLDGIFTGGTPVEEIARKGKCWAFIATIGPAVEARVREHFDAGRYLEGVILDAAGSVAVEGVCDLAEGRIAGSETSARFSPGYCMWRLENQRGLFTLLHPEEIGIRLLPSMLMHPLKSVSGVVVRAPTEDLLVPIEACDGCDANECARRRGH